MISLWVEPLVAAGKEGNRDKAKCHTARPVSYFGRILVDTTDSGDLQTDETAGPMKMPSDKGKKLLCFSNANSMPHHAAVLETCFETSTDICLTV